MQVKLAWIIQRLPEEELPEVTVPTEKELRSLVTEQVGLTQSKTREINRLHALFVQDGITTEKKKDLKRSEMRKERYRELSETIGLRAERYERLIEAFEKNLEEVEDKGVGSGT